MNVHIDEELRVHAAQTLQTLMSECVEWREDIIHSFLNYMTTQSSVRHVLAFLEYWLRMRGFVKEYKNFLLSLSRILNHKIHFFNTFRYVNIGLRKGMCYSNLCHIQHDFKNDS